MKIDQNKLNELCKEISIDFNSNSKITFEKYNTLNTDNIRLETNTVATIDNVTCVFVDMENSTQRSIGDIEKAVMIHMPYIRTIVKFFEFFDSKYIDIQGDGGFALFTGIDSQVKGLFAALMINSILNKELNLKVKIGIDCGTVYVKKAGKRGQNKEIWLGRPVCFASKLCNIESETISNKIRVSKAINDGVAKEINAETFLEGTLYGIDVYSLCE